MQKQNGTKFLIGFVILILVCGVAASVWIKSAYDTRLPIVMHEPEKKTIGRLYDSKIYDKTELLSAPIESKIDLKKQIKGSKQLQHCQTAYISYAETDFKTFTEQFLHLPDIQNCADLPEFGITKQVKKEISDFCFKAFDSKQCDMRLLQLRILSVDYLTERISLKDLSEKQLMMKMMAKIWKIKMPEDGPRLKELGDELYARNPQDPNAQEAYLLGHLISVMDNPAKANTTDEVNQTLDRLMLERPNDEKLEDFKFMSELNLDKETRFKLAYDRALQNPDSAAANYALASLYNKNGDHENELKVLQRAVNIAGNNARYTETLRKFKAGERENIYTFSFSFGVSES